MARKARYAPRRAALNLPDTSNITDPALRDHTASLHRELERVTQNMIGQSNDLSAPASTITNPIPDMPFVVTNYITRTCVVGETLKCFGRRMVFRGGALVEVSSERIVSQINLAAQLNLSKKMSTSTTTTTSTSSGDPETALYLAWGYLGP